MSTEWPLSGPKDFARQFHGGVTHGDGHLADARFGANALGDAERAGHYLIEQSADGAFGLRDGVGAFQLTENLRFADDHGVQTGGDAKQMLNGIAGFEAVQMAFEGVRGTFPGLQESLDNTRRVRCHRRP